jgi:hypothetical protein
MRNQTVSLGPLIAETHKIAYFFNFSSWNFYFVYFFRPWPR